MLVLYHNEMSSSSQKVRLALAEKELAFESRPVNLRTGEHQQDWYRALNPRAVVPTLVDDGVPLQESTVINEYLDELCPERPLMPGTPRGRAQVRLWTKQIDESIHDGCIAVLAFAIAFREPLLAQGEAAFRQLEQIPDPFKRERRRDVLEHGVESAHVRLALVRMRQLLDDMEAALGSGAWIAGEMFTLADVSLVPYMTRLCDLQLGGLLQPRGRVQSWFERCQARPSYAAAVTAWDNANALAMMRQAGQRFAPQLAELAQAR